MKTPARRETLMNPVVLQAGLCLLIALWGVSMIVIGMVWSNVVWCGLGAAVLVVGLPFLRNLLPDRPRREVR
jgi:hypothetical protein